MLQVPASKKKNHKLGSQKAAAASAASQQCLHCCRSLLAVCPASRQGWAMPASPAMRLQVPAGTRSVSQQDLWSRLDQDHPACGCRSLLAVYPAPWRWC